MMVPYDTICQVTELIPTGRDMRPSCLFVFWNSPKINSVDNALCIMLADRFSTPASYGFKLHCGAKIFTDSGLTLMTLLGVGGI